MEVIKSIINKSISNFIYVDDRVCNAYENNEFISSTKALHDVFNCNDMHIKIIQYHEGLTLNHLDNLFIKNDILILDWKLDGEEFNTTVIDILDKAIQHNDIKYIFIYTDYDFNAKLGILASYHKYVDSEILISKLVCPVFDSINFDKDSELYHATTYEYFVDYINNIIDKENFLFQILNHIAIDGDEATKIVNILRRDKFFNALEKMFYQEFFEFYNIEKSVIDHSRKIVSINDTTLKIDNINISVVKKETGNPKYLIDKIFESLNAENNSFFSMLNHEVLHNFKKNFFNKARQISHINNAVVINKNNSSELEEFVETIYSDIFKSTIRNGESHLINNIDSFMDGKKIINPTENEVKLINYTSSINFSKNDLVNFSKKIISFGDVFKINNYESFGYKYAICITAHCDCLRPTKIDNTYSFVFSNLECKLEKEIDSKFLTFITDNEDEIKIIDWSDGQELKPRSLHIDENILTDTISATYAKKDAQLSFIAQQKENFTQRLANEVFRYPMRVGVTYIGKQD